MSRGLAPRRATLLLCAVGCGAAAEPYTPASDGVVLATLTRPQGLSSEQIRQLRGVLERDPSDAGTAARLAHLYAALNSSSGEPRYLGYATAVLAPWDGVVAPPTSVWLIRARIAQRLHRFAEAQADLKALLVSHPANSEAALLLSTVGIVRGDYPAAIEACAQLAAQREQTLAVICTANLSPYLGRADVGARGLEAVIEGDSLSPEVETWVLTLAAELAVGRGAAADAEARYQAALTAMRDLDAPDSYLLGSYADFLTDRGEGARALTLLDSAPATDGVLIRRALATANMDSRRKLTEQLRDRMTVLVRRNDDAHARELAWVHLSLFDDATAGLEYARRNWRQQREMRDARLLLEAAISARDIDAAQPVIDWVETNNIRHAWLDGLVDQWRRATTQ